MVGADARKAAKCNLARWPALGDGVVGLLDLEQNVAAAPPRRAVPGHAQAGRAMRKPAVHRRGRGAGLDGHTLRRAAARSRAQHAGLSLLVTIGSEVLINSKTGFDLPTLVLDEVQTLSAVCEERYRVSLPMRGARAFHESKTFGESEREN